MENWPTDGPHGFSEEQYTWLSSTFCYLKGQGRALARRRVSAQLPAPLPGPAPAAKPAARTSKRAVGPDPVKSTCRSATDYFDYYCVHCVYCVYCVYCFIVIIAIIVIMTIMAIIFIIRIITIMLIISLSRRNQGGALDAEAAQAGDEDKTHSDPDVMMTASSKKRKTNQKGLAILSNGVVSMSDLDLASQVPTKIRDDEAAELFKAKLTLSKAFTFFTFLLHGKNLPVEKVRDESARAILLYSAALYCLSQETLATILDADSDERKAYLIGLAKNTQQIMQYVLPGLVGNYMNEKVLTSRDVFPADDVKLHLGLTSANAQKCFMELYDYVHYIYYFYYIHYLTIGVLCWQIPCKV